jgi:hypothetical protein
LTPRSDEFALIAKSTSVKGWLDFQNYICAAAAISAVGSASVYVFFTVKMDKSIPAFA